MAQDGRAARYAFVPVREGTLRLDTANGAVSLCTGQDGVVTCRPLPDRDPDLRAAIRDIAARVAGLETRMAARPEEPAARPGALVRIVHLGDEAGSRLLASMRRWKAAWD